MLDGPLDELAAFFCAPAKSGVYVTKNELILLARLSDASLRISERRRMLADVLKSAASTEELAGMVDRLRAFSQDSLDTYEQLLAASPASRTPIEPWIEKARATIERLEKLAAEIRL